MPNPSPHSPKMRTTDEIVARLNQIKADDFFGFESEDLVVCLPFEAARPWLKPDATADQWKEASAAPDAVRARVLDYLPFAVEKASTHRGLSASRSISHMRAWMWLLGDDEMLAFLNDDANYANYGAPMLMQVAEKYGATLNADDGFRRMAQGKACDPSGCDEGCGHA